MFTIKLFLCHCTKLVAFSGSSSLIKLGIDDIVSSNVTKLVADVQDSVLYCNCHLTNSDATK